MEVIGLKLCLFVIGDYDFVCNLKGFKELFKLQLIRRLNLGEVIVYPQSSAELMSCTMDRIRNHCFLQNASVFRY